MTTKQIKPNTKPAVTAALTRALGLQNDLTQFYQFAKHNHKLRTLTERFRGLKPPCFPTVFEALLNGIACQQVSLNLGILLLNRLSTTYGKAIQIDDSIFHAFPRPEDLSELEPNAFRKLGFSHQKGRAIIELSRKIAYENLNLEYMQALEDEAVLENLYQLRGVGRWTGEYVLLRGLERTHIFPLDDVGGRNNLEHWLNLENSLDYEGAKRIVDRWKPFAGLIYFHLLLDRLDEKGYLNENKHT